MQRPRHEATCRAGSYCLRGCAATSMLMLPHITLGARPWDHSPSEWNASKWSPVPELQPLAINVNECVTQFNFGNVYGRLNLQPDRIMRAAEVMIGGWAGTRVLVKEIDPIGALRTCMEGFQVDDAVGAKIGKKQPRHPRCQACDCWQSWECPDCNSGQHQCRVFLLQAVSSFGLCSGKLVNSMRSNSLPGDRSA